MRHSEGRRSVMEHGKAEDRSVETRVGKTMKHTSHEAEKPQTEARSKSATPEIKAPRKRSGSAGGGSTGAR